MQLLQLGNVKLNVKRSNYCKNTIKPEETTRDEIKEIEEARKETIQTIRKETMETMETISEETEEYDISDNIVNNSSDKT
jgi:uncharacterized protein YnzC (UPF0291/DUF896 family)